MVGTSIAINILFTVGLRLYIYVLFIEYLSLCLRSSINNASYLSTSRAELELRFVLLDNRDLSGSVGHYT